MVDNPVLDVAIGLIFIYVLYSLLATTIKELIATMFSYRGKMLERGIEQMLDGENVKYFWWSRLYVYLVKLVGKNPSDNSNYCKKSGLFAKKIADHPLYKRSAEKAGTKRPAYLAANTFSDIFIDIFTTDNTRPVLLKDIENAIETILTGDKHADLKKILKIYLAQANGDLQRFKLLVEKWYDDSMDRVSGWYKKQAYKILLVIGFVLAVLFNVSTIEIVQKLSDDRPLREAMVNSASAYVKANQDKFKPKPDPAKKDTTKADTAKKDTTKADTAKKNTINTDSARRVRLNDTVKAGLANIKDLYNTTIKPQNTSLGLGWGDFGFKDDSTKWARDSIKLCKAGTLGKNVICAIGPKPVEKNFLEKVWFVLKQLSLVKLIGFLITALAISLGAPFWFDLLNKFINLRVSGKKPDDDTSSSKMAAKNEKPDPKSFA